MIRLTWRQFRIQAAVAFARARGRSRSSWRSRAAPRPPLRHERHRHLQGAERLRRSSINAFLTRLHVLQDLARPRVLAVPALLGIFWGAPLLARELETGTYRLAWTQSVTRTRWLAVKLAVVGLAGIAVAGLFSLMVTWWSSPIDKVSMSGVSRLTANRFAPAVFDERNIAPLGYAAFAIALGVTVGLLLRRTLPAMAVTLAVFVGIQILMPTLVRPNLLSSKTVTVSRQPDRREPGPRHLHQRWRRRVLYPTAHTTRSVGDGCPSSGELVRSSGNRIQSQQVPVPRVRQAVRPRPAAPTLLTSSPAWPATTCTKASPTNPRATTGPSEWYETGIFLGLAAALSGSCFWWIRRRRN